jgi:hypothetical protein
MNNNNQNAQGIGGCNFSKHIGEYIIVAKMVGASMTKCITWVLLSQDVEKTTLFQIHDFLFRNHIQKFLSQCEHMDQALYRTHLITNPTK